jgi:rSAM/selenodomain-associated transferase 1
MTAWRLPVTIIVLAKVPRPGRVKTRLTPPYTPAEAAKMAAASLADTLRAVAGVPVARRVLALDEDAGRWCRPGFTVVRQRGKGLDERITLAFDDVFADSPLPALLVGMDTPQVTSADLTEAADALLDAGAHQAVLGPAMDGGFWALGLNQPLANGLVGVPMSQPNTCARTRERLRESGVRVRMLARHRDVDDATSAAAVAALAPYTRFAATHAALEPAGLTA